VLVVLLDVVVVVVAVVNPVVVPPDVLIISVPFVGGRCGLTYEKNGALYRLVVLNTVTETASDVPLPPGTTQERLVSEYNCKPVHGLPPTDTCTTVASLPNCLPVIVVRPPSIVVDVAL